MTNPTGPFYWCRAHRQPTPPGYMLVPNLDHDKKCQTCSVLADFEVAQKPLTYPTFNNA